MVCEIKGIGVNVQEDVGIHDMQQLKGRMRIMYTNNLSMTC